MIYGRFGDPVTIVRRAVLDDVKALDGRMPDSQDVVMDVHVRGISPEVWRALRVEAVQCGISVAKLIELLWKERQRVGN